MKKQLLYSVVVLAVLILGVWAYLFHGYISGSRWAWVKYKLGTLDSPFGDSREARLVVYKGWSGRHR